MLHCEKCTYNVFDDDYGCNFCLLLDPPTILIKPERAKTDFLNETNKDFLNETNNVFLNETDIEYQKTTHTTLDACIFYKEGDT